MENTNLKALEERKNDLIEEMNSMVSTIEVEKRDLDNNESTRFTEIEDEVRNINEEIAKFKEKQLLQSQEIKEEKRDMEKRELEVRELANFIREKRADGISVTTDGAATIPELVENNIIMKLDEASEVFAEARRLPSQAGSLKIPRENSIAVAGFVGELEDVAGIKLDLSEAELTQKRVGAFTGLTNQLVHDSAVDIVGYAEENLARAAARAIEASIFNGKGDAAKQFKGITADTDVEVIEAAEITVDALMDVHNALHPSFLPTAKFYMSRKMYNVIAKLKDGNGHFYVQNGIVNGVPTKTLFETPVVVSDALTDEKPIVLGSLSQGYTVMVKKDMFLRHITGDSRNALAGTQLLVLDAYMDGVVHDPQAFVVVQSSAVEG